MELLTLPFPAIDPVAISVGPFAVKWYGLAYVAGLLIGWYYINRLVTAEKLWGDIARPNTRQVDDLLLYVALGVVIGGRTGYVLFYDLPTYLANPAEILQVWHGGMSFHGGLLGAGLGQYIFARRAKVGLLSVFDLVCGAVPIGLFFGRIANFINGELWGRVTDVPWAMVFPTGGPFSRHPSQLYEAALEGLLLFAALGLAIRSGALKKPGLIAGLFGIGYGLARIFVEFFRQPDPQLGYLAFDFITMGMVLSLPMVFVGSGLVTYALKARK